MIEADGATGQGGTYAAAWTMPICLFSVVGPRAAHEPSNACRGIESKNLDVNLSWVVAGSSKLLPSGARALQPMVLSG